ALRSKDFATCTAEEIALLARLMTRLRVRPPMRRTRRRAPARSGDPDLRRTLRQAMRTGGEPIDRRWRRRRTRRRRLVLVLDVSGSMSTYSRALAMFTHAALRSGPDWEAFAFGTRLTRVTRALAEADPDAAFAAAAAEVADWDGGTRIGESLRTLLDEHARSVRGAVCVILSDGLDVGDPALLAEQMERLSRLAHRVVWLNPLKGAEGYAPLARGMAAALPHVDEFRAGHNLRALEEMADLVTRL
ncbi:MAG: VWA domain-containing protein, partial [Thermoleophilia bacterium]